jgi:phosphate starvation-inducible PhoH-like protein
MTETRTLQFENARAVQSLYAHDLKLIKNLEESLGVKVTTREGWIKVEGEPAQVAKAEQVFTQLENARQRGVEIQRHEFNYALNSVNEARADNLDDLVMTKVVTSARKPAIVARTLGQRNYLEAIQKHDVVFGIGPAGTGKTYLAVAMAIPAVVTFFYSARLANHLAGSAGSVGSMSGDEPRHSLGSVFPIGAGIVLSALYFRIDVFLVDDWAMAPLADSERRDFLEICDDRYATRSTILTSQVPLTQWARSNR